MHTLSNEAKKILEAIRVYGPVRSTELVKMLHVSTKTIYKHLSKLLDERHIKKTGTTPKVFYAIHTDPIQGAVALDVDDQIIEQNYIYVSPNGDIFRGINGFQIWCNKNRFRIEKEKQAYIRKITQIQKMKKNGLLSAKKNIVSGKKDLFLDEVYFSDFYTFDHFGKTKLGQLVYVGKSSQNKALIMEIVQLIRPAITEIVKEYAIGLICFVPPTIDRKIQFMDVLKKRLNMNIPEIQVMKIPSLTKIPQKTLRKLEDRILNAQSSIAVNPNQKISSNVLIIDDATGSGATLNETAKKMRSIAKKNITIIGYSIVGSSKGFDVISEV